MTGVASAVRGLLASEKYADLTIRCRGKVFKTHCAIVCTQSDFLATAVDGKFKEAALRDIDLSEDELPIVTAAIRFLYTGDYNLVDAQDCEPHTSNRSSQPLSVASSSTRPETPNRDEPEASPEPCSAESLLFHVKVYIIANLMQIQELKALAKEKYEAVVINHWNSHMFSESAQHLWDNTTDSDLLLRDVVAGAASQHVEELLDRGEFVELMSSHGGFCLEVLRIRIGRELPAPAIGPEPEDSQPAEADFGEWGSLRPKKDKKKKGKFGAMTFDEI